MRYTMEQAIACAQIIKESASVPVAIYVFGSISEHGSGNDVDLLFEVEPSVFGGYVEQVAGEGVHSLLKMVEDRADLYWSYFSPKEVRFVASLQGVGINCHEWVKLDMLGSIVPVTKIDIICLPSNWMDTESNERKVLEEQIRKDDPVFFERLERTVRQIA